MKLIVLNMLFMMLFGTYRAFGNDKNPLTCLKFQLQSLVKEIKTKNNYTYHEHVVNPKLHKDQLKSYIKSIDKIIYGKLEVPDSHTYYIAPEGEVAGFMKQENHFHFPARLVAERGTVDEITYNSMLAHEYGHAIFHHNLDKVDSMYLKNMNLVKQYDDLYRELNKLKTLENEDLRINEIQNKILLFNKKEVDVARLDTLFISAFHELFADFVAVIKTKDLDSMKKLMTKTSVEEDGLERSFKRVLPVKGWDYESPYFALAPTRSYIGQILGSSVDLKTNRGIIKDVFDSIVKQLKITRESMTKQYQKNPAMAVYEYEHNIEKMNQGIIDHLANVYTK